MMFQADPRPIDGLLRLWCVGLGATCNASMTLNNYTLHEGEVYHKNHVPNGSAPLPTAIQSQTPVVSQTTLTSGGDRSDVAEPVPTKTIEIISTPASKSTVQHDGSDLKSTAQCHPQQRVVPTKSLLQKVGVPETAGVHRPKGTAESLEKFKDIQAQGPDEQSRFFLMAFAMEFTGRSDEILERAEGFKRYLEPGMSSLSEVDSHRLLEEMGRARTYQDMREMMREIDQDSDGRVSLIEWLLFELGKTLDELYETKCPPELEKTMQEAIDRWRKVQAAKAAKLTEAQELELLVQQGGVKGARAALRLAQIKQLGVQGSEIEEDIRADRQKKKAEKLVEAHAKETAAAEEARVQELRRQEEEDRRLARERGRASLAAIAANFGQGSEA